jgi:phosphatidate cytidylyltransferase
MEGSRRPPARRRRQGGSDLGARVLVAIPAAAFAVFIVTQGGLIFALGLVALSTIALSELYTLMRRVRPVDIVGFLAVAGMILGATYGDEQDILIALVAAFPAVFFLSLARRRRENVAWAIAVTIFGVAWVGLPMSHAVLLRELPHGDGLLIDVLVATFIGDTGAYFAGRLYGRTPLAPLISPNKTMEGLVGGLVAGTLAFWLAGLYQDWLTGADALLIGAMVAFAAPVGDLFESLIKRDLDAKDAGNLFGAHGGVLDRLDAVFFTVIVGYYAALALGYA